MLFVFGAGILFGRTMAWRFFEKYCSIKPITILLLHSGGWKEMLLLVENIFNNVTLDLTFLVVLFGMVALFKNSPWLAGHSDFPPLSHLTTPSIVGMWWWKTTKIHRYVQIQCCTTNQLHHINIKLQIQCYPQQTTTACKAFMLQLLSLLIVNCYPAILNSSWCFLRFKCTTRTHPSMEKFCMLLIAIIKIICCHQNQ